MESFGECKVEKLLLQAIFDRSWEAMVIVDQQNRFVAVNPSACKLFESSPEELISKSILDFFPYSLDTTEEQNIVTIEIPQINGTIQTIEYTKVEGILPTYTLLIFRDVTHLKRSAAAELHLQHQRIQLFSEVTLKIRQSLQLKEILQTAVTEVQRILKADRVLIYQVLPNGTGIPISEAVLPNYSPILGMEFPEEVFPPEYRELYAQGRVQAISNVHSPDANLAECLIEFMDEWMVKAKLVVPILQNIQPKTGKNQVCVRLWGLLIAHQCQTTREWTEFELELMQQLADQMGIALSQGELLENLEELVAERTANLQQEINERLEVEAALRRSEEQLRLIANGLPVLIAYVDKHQRYRFNNEAYQTWLGLSPTEIYGCHLQGVHEQQEYKKIQEHIEAALSGKQVTYENDIPFQDGCIHSVNVTYIPHINQQEKDEVKGFFALSSDISDRIAIERMKDEFISVVSHELRTPLTSIHSSLKILATGKLGNLSSKGQRMLNIADEQTERLVRLVNNVLDLQSIQSGKITMNKKACKATELMIEATQAMQMMAQEHGVKLFAESVSLVVWADRDYIIQTLTNLLSNAIKFSPSNSCVWLLAKMEETKKKNISYNPQGKTNSYVTFAVKDKGQGIPENQLENIFERFQQVDSSDSRKKGGTGLGLTICRQIIKEHGGDIWVESRKGDGSTFYFTLPALINVPE
ncbi:MAG: ATP-binding protein [Cyanobacteria bacterium P01_A01_bin.45]